MTADLPSPAQNMSSYRAEFLEFLSVLDWSRNRSPNNSLRLSCKYLRVYLTLGSRQRTSPLGEISLWVRDRSSVCIIVNAGKRIKCQVLYTSDCLQGAPINLCPEWIKKKHASPLWPIFLQGLERIICIVRTSLAKILPWARTAYALRRFHVIWWSAAFLQILSVI